jgi:hypothetical protein
MKTISSTISRRSVLAGGLGLLFLSQALCSVAMGQAISTSRGRTGLRGGASVVTYSNNSGGASVVAYNNNLSGASFVTQPGLNVPPGDTRLNIQQRNALRGRPATYFVGGYADLGGYANTEPSIYIGGDYVVNYFSGPMPATPRVNFNYALLRRSEFTHRDPGSLMTVDGFVSGLPEENWPRGPLLHSFWNENAMTTASTNVNFLLNRVSNFAISAPARTRSLPVGYLAAHPLVYFPQPGQFVLNYAMADVLRRKMSNGGIFIFDDYPGNPLRMDYLNQIRRQFSDFEVTSLPLDNPFTPGFFTVQIKPRPAVVDGVRQSTFTLVSETAEPNNSGHDGISVSSYFGADGQVIILAN